MTRQITRTVAAAAILAAAAGVAAAQLYVTQNGSFDPDGSVASPFRTLHSSACASLDNPGPVLFEAGGYGGLGTFIAPATLQSMGGPVVLGDQGADSTSLRVVSFNTHLFGNAVPAAAIDALVFFGIIDPLTWQDPARAERIGQWMASHTADVYALQEVWDSSLWTSIFNNSGLPDGSYGSTIDPDDFPCMPVPGPPWCVDFPVLNMGVGTITRPDIVEARQAVYAAETGDDDFFEPFSSKGFVFTEIIKGGFRVAVYNTHLQAGPASNAAVFAARESQLLQLRGDVIAYRAANPGVPVILAGDFNIVGAGSPTSEYQQRLRAVFESFDFTDAAREIYCFRANNGNSTDNDVGLGLYFNPDDSGGVRLDYILYADSLDGSVELVLRTMGTYPLLGPGVLTENGFTSAFLSDHFVVDASFDVIRRD